jgi:hypothetical protein
VVPDTWFQHPVSVRSVLAPVPVLADLLEVAGEGIGVEDAVGEDGAPELAAVGLDGELGGVEEDLGGGGWRLGALGGPGEEFRGGAG